MPKYISMHEKQTPRQLAKAKAKPSPLRISAALQVYVTLARSRRILRPTTCVQASICQSSLETGVPVTVAQWDRYLPGVGRSAGYFSSKGLARMPQSAAPDVHLACPRSVSAHAQCAECAHRNLHPPPASSHHPREGLR